MKNNRRNRYTSEEKARREATERGPRRPMPVNPVPKRGPRTPEEVCASKRRFLTAESAQEIIEATNRACYEDGPHFEIRPYRCPVCQLWHLATVRK